MTFIELDDKKPYLDIIFKFIPKDDSVVFLFGSLAEKTASRASDIDIGIFCSQKIDRSVLAACRIELQEKIKTLRDIDLVDFTKIKDDKFVSIAIKNIVVWHQLGPAVKKFEELVKDMSNQKRNFNG